MENVEIIKLHPENWGSLREIRLESLKSEPDAFGGTYEAEVAYPDEKWKERASDPNRFFLLANDRGKPVGTVGMAKSRDENEPDTLIVTGMYVNKEYRGRGIGKSLLQEAIQQSRSIQGMRRIKLWVHQEQKPAVGLYQLCGLVITGEVGEDPTLDPMYHNTTIMSLDL